MEYSKNIASKKIDFDAINSLALNCFESLLRQWLPDGKKSCSEFTARNPKRNDTHPGSFSINIENGVWCDFATGDKGGDPISLFAYLFHNNDQGAAAKALGNILGVSAITKHVVDKPKKSKSEWVAIMPPLDAPEPHKAHLVRGKPETVWCYRDFDGQPLGYAYLFIKSDGRKEVLPLTWCKNSKTGKEEWRWKSFEEPRHLYGLDRLAAKPDATILIVEGEKCADAAAKHLPDSACLTWPGGCKAVGKVDWKPLTGPTLELIKNENKKKPLTGRKIIIWPDCDAQKDKYGVLLPEIKQPGVMAANKIAEKLLSLGCKVWMVKIPLPGEKKDGWDIVDAIAEGLTGDDLRDNLRENIRLLVDPELEPEPERRLGPPLEAYAADSAALPDTTTTTHKNRKKKPTPHVGNSAESLLEILKRYIFLKNHNRIYDTMTRNELSREGFDGAFCHLFPENKISMVFLNDPECIKVDGLIYLPGETVNPVNRNGAVLWNIWCDPGVKLPDNATKEDVEPWREHLHYLYPNEKEQDHLLNWMAFVLQQPQTKINHALLIAGTSGVGKDMLLNPLRYGLGSANVCEPPAEELKEAFTDYLHHSKLVIFQEIQSFEGLNLENKLKPMLASPPDMLRVRMMHTKHYETPNLIQAIFMSNYRDALHISAGDRRYFAIWTDKKPQEPEYYSNLANWQENGGNGLVVRWLLDRDISQFNPKANAPTSTFKTKLLETSKSSLKHLLEDMIAAEDYPFNVDCVRSIDISKHLHDKFSAKSIGAVLSEIGCQQMLCKRSTGTKRGVLSLFAVRNIGEKERPDPSVWQDKVPSDWIVEYDDRTVRNR